MDTKIISQDLDAPLAQFKAENESHQASIDQNNVAIRAIEVAQKYILQNETLKKQLIDAGLEPVIAAEAVIEKP